MHVRSRYSTQNQKKSKIQDYHWWLGLNQKPTYFKWKSPSMSLANGFITKWSQTLDGENQMKTSLNIQKNGQRRQRGIKIHSTPKTIS